jgi:L-aminopeptidase/D-esterase-like protein
MSAPLPLPPGFRVGHWTREDGATGCTVVLVPAGARGSVTVLGGGTGTRELEPLSPAANAEGPNAILFTGGSAFGLAAAEGVMRWLAERGIGRPTPPEVVPLVPAAVIFDLHAGGRRPGPDQGYAACEGARDGTPERGSLGAGAGAAVGKALGRERATRAGVGYGAARLAAGVTGATTVAALTVVNAVGDVLDADGAVLGGPRDPGGRLLRSSELFARLDPGMGWPVRPGESTTLACLCTDAPLDKRDCAIVSRMAAAGVARAIDPVFTPLDGDVIFCVASGAGTMPPRGVERSLLLSAIGTVAAGVVAGAIRDAVRLAARPG